jgi:FkbM family methyltransferase
MIPSDHSPTTEDRRSFLRRGVSGSFLLGTVGGAAVGAGGMYAYEQARRGPAKLSYAQQGEDLILENIFHLLQIERPSFLDIGAWDPILSNNTYLLYLQGARGVLVEPNPAFTRKLIAARPGDKVLGVGIGLTEEKESDYYLIAGDGGDQLNTFSKEQAEAYPTKTDGKYRIQEVIKIPLVNINTVIEENLGKAPNLVSIDVEGLDVDILKSLDFDRYRPDVFCIETAIYGTPKQETEILQLMESKHYAIRGGSFVNTIFIDRKRLEGKQST